ncbi:LSM domain-containing protein [Tritrichomonas foetus]|uniref:LSM domain-containing protein n=1 Tax=Tritrichomonas foetus TaxID=1144522 RepID=A0A1J4L081_9EUKA|nr:LSM domain-containing protein [Tritrichomonas foetus]|eukprot:OHT16818.1 LSM domain-containing protein [Tritrichomonas foetus]
MKLVHFLRKLVRENVQIELKDNTIINGTVVGVDSAMNTHVRLVQIKRPGQPEERLENMTIRGASIRYVILPEVINLGTLLVDDRPKKTRIRHGESKEEADRKPKLFNQRKY